MFAAKYNNIEIAKLLISNNAIVNYKIKNRVSALSLALEYK